MFLTDKELEELTGLKRGKEQCDYLALNGWTFFKDVHGKPKVSVEYAKCKLGETKETNQRFQLKFA